MRASQFTTLLTGGLFSAALISAAYAQGPDAISSGSEWTQYRGNLSGTGFSPLTQINQANVSDLEGAWSYSMASCIFQQPTGLLRSTQSPEKNCGHIESSRGPHPDAVSPTGRETTALGRASSIPQAVDW